MTSPVDVANESLDAIGAGYTITSLSPPLPAPNAATVARHYAPKRDAVFRSAHWNSLRRQASLTVLKAAQGTPENPNGTTIPIPPFPWLYEYALPDDCLAARFLIYDPPLSTGTTPPIYPSDIGIVQRATWGDGWKFVVGIDTDARNNQKKILLTDLQYADLVYTARIETPDLWDPHLHQAVVATLASFLVNPINMNLPLLKSQVEMATGIIQQARISDGNEGFESVDHMPDWMAARGNAYFGMGPPGVGQAFYGWSTIAFPGGVLL
jgi:hypothetical protein